MAVQRVNAYRTEMLDVVARGIARHPRSLQTRIGPSGLGTPCARKLGHRLNETPACAARTPAWRPTVGTAAHTWLTSTYNEENKDYPVTARWLTDMKVTVGLINGIRITGHLDLYDLHTATVIDWKVVGPTSLKRKKASGSPGDEYRAQVHLYGRGVRALNLPCTTVGILFLPSSGELAESLYWSEPYDEQIALDALARADAIASAIHTLGAERVLPQLDTANDFCSWCDYFKPGTTELATQCPGDVTLASTQRGDQFSDLIGAK